MPRDEQKLALLSEHMGWARTYAIYWLITCLAVFGGAYAIADMIDISPENRGPLLIMLGTIIIVSAVWQAAGLLVVRLEQVVLPRARSGIAP
jgi:hypothetical protein